MRRETLIVSGVALIVLVVSVVLFTGRSSSLLSLIGAQPATAVPFTTLTQGRQSTVEKRVNYVITTPTELNQLWKVVDATGTPPKVDFNKQTVIAVFAGNESSSSIAVAKIEDANARMVSIAITKPDCSAQSATASPYEIVAVPATSLPLTHTDIATIVTCRN